MKKLTLAVLLSFWSVASLAAGYEHIPNKFFSLIEKGEVNGAIDYLYDTNKWVSKKSDQVINLKNQLSQLTPLVGNYIYHELVSETKVGTRYAHLIYIVGYERQPLRYEIKVYKVKNGWRFQGVSFDASITDDIEKQANQRLTK